jgi:hypothetical protein
MRQHVHWRGMSTRIVDVMGNFTHHRYYAWPVLVLRLHSPLVRFQLPRYPRRHIRQPRICHGAIRPCLGALNGLSYRFNYFHGWRHVICSGTGGLVFIYSSAHLLMWCQEHFLYAVLQYDVIDTLVEMDLANGCGGRDLVYLLAWRSLMLLVHNETLLREDDGSVELRSDMQVAYTVKRQVECRKYGPIEPRAMTSISTSDHIRASIRPTESPRLES